MPRRKPSGEHLPENNLPALSPERDKRPAVNKCPANDATPAAHATGQHRSGSSKDRSPQIDQIARHDDYSAVAQLVQSPDNLGR